MHGWILWLAQGCGLGRCPVAPGTVGSLGGLLWCGFLSGTGHPAIYGAGLLAGLALSVWACGRAEIILRQKDPSSVVLDEVAAVPLAFLPWVLSAWLREGTTPPVEAFFQGQAWLGTSLLFGLFRVFDIVKPWPIRGSQRWPGGWGITVDDVLAAGYTALLSLIMVV